MDQYKEKQERADAKLAEARALLTKDGITEDESHQADLLMQEVRDLKAQVARLKEIEDLEAEAEKDRLAAEERAATDEAVAQSQNKGYKSFGQFLTSVYQARNPDRVGPPDARLKKWNDPSDKDDSGTHFREGKATMVENIGARGGFLVPVEQRLELLGDEWEKSSVIRSRATIIPMRRRQVNIPVLDQTGTTAGQPHQYGGIIATWTEEQGQKDQNDPTFRQVELVAHKLVCYTRSSDELLDDEAIGLDAFLRSDMGFAGAIRWQEEYAFLRGTGAGMPLGVINAGATISQARAADGTVGIADILNMIHHFQGENPVWHIQRCLFPQVAQMSGPAGNASYVFIPNAREGIPATLFGYDIIWTEKLPAAGVAGDVLLADWKRYLIGDRQATTIETTNIERFRNDETSWRAVHRVDGQPWLSTPWTTADGSHTISPFVILGGKAAT